MLQHCNVAVATAAATAASIFDLSYVACNKPRPISRWPRAHRKCSTASTSASLYLFIAAAGAKHCCSCSCWLLLQLRQVLLISEIKWRTPNHGRKRSKTHIKLRHNANASRLSSYLLSTFPFLPPSASLSLPYSGCNALPAISQ